MRNVGHNKGSMKISLINNVNSKVELVQVGETKNHIIRVSSILEGEVKIGIVACLKKNRDIFAWNLIKMTNID